MSYYLYEYKTTIEDSELQTMVTDVNSAMSLIVGMVFVSANIPLHVQITTDFRNDGKCLKANRTYDAENHTLITRRYFANEQDAIDMKNLYDPIYEANREEMVNAGTVDMFSFENSIVEISNEEFEAATDTLYP